MGLVGLPNVGKSTTFNFLSKMSVPAENYPFCTIEPTVAKVNVPDKRFDHLCEVYHPKSKVLAQVSITDIAGLVKGASKGEGLGNAFLSHIAAVDGIFHVVRAFPDEDVMHNDGEVDPLRDIDTINGELIAKDIQSLEHIVSVIETELKRAKDKKKGEAALALIEKVRVMLEKGEAVRDGIWTQLEIAELNKHLFITAKPVVYLANIGDK